MAAALIWAAPAAATAQIFPGQFVVKQFTEGLGRVPNQIELGAWNTYFSTNPCNQSTLRYLGEAVLLGAEFQGRGYTNESRVLIAYRMILNREPDAPGYYHHLNLLNAGLSWTDLVAALFQSSEFVGLILAICHSTQTSYHWGTWPVIDIPLGSSGFSGSQTQLQALLNSTPPGGTVWLAQRAVVRLTSTLTIPSGVALRTTGAVTPAQYADMARLVRDSGFNAPLVRLSSGARLIRVWVDGQRGVPSNTVGWDFNVLMTGGSGTEVNNSRLDNSRGWTTLAAFGTHEIPDHQGVTACVSNRIARNLITVYSSAHSQFWTDGISVACEDAQVTLNQIVDATDVSLILFRANPATQRSKVANNTILSAGNSSFAALALETHSPHLPPDGPGQASIDFTGTLMENNTLWTSSRTHFDLGISVGIRAWSGSASQNGTGAQVTNNTTGGLAMRADSAIAVSGMLNATVTDNTLNTFLVNTIPCPTLAVGASVSTGYASGNIQAHTDALYSACIAAGHP